MHQSGISDLKDRMEDGGSGLSVSDLAELTALLEVETPEERRKRKAREYQRIWQARNRAKMAAKVRAWRERPGNADKVRQANAARKAAQRRRGVVATRLTVPRNLASLAARLRWRTPVSSNGEWRPSLAWDAVMLYTVPARQRKREGYFDKELSGDAAARWLRVRALV